VYRDQSHGRIEHPTFDMVEKRVTAARQCVFPWPEGFAAFSVSLLDESSGI
jgi:hypothetical protein